MLPKLTQKQTEVKRLGIPKIDSPLKLSTQISLHSHVLYNPYYQEKNKDRVSFEISIPENKIYFDPKKVTAGIVTCGGICPGLNNVIRAIVLGMHYNYGVSNIYGIRYGLQGFIAKYELPIIKLTPEAVSNIHEIGGTILGSSRGEQPIDEIVDFLEHQNMNILYVIGGDGTLRATERITQEIYARNLKIAVVAIPKTIDNDIAFVHRSFGFETAVDIATQSIQGAHAEATSFPNGIGLVKLMGRHSGFIAASAAIAQRDVNYVFIPEIDFDLDGPKGFLSELKKRMLSKSHAVIVVAEGAGQKFFEKQNQEKDASGNIKLMDIGVYLKDRITRYFKEENIPLNLKYIDPSYLIRSVAANTNDGLFCATLGQNAVHAAMAGKTEVLVSNWHGVYCNLPISLAISQKKTIHPGERLWLNVLESTGQPSFQND
ncbi:MAG: ATP-dependent 6-phosphofructokinase [Deltaproteobacteria bacterium]|nr:ATP-dependent 6-phosphofructokinase [Deltaproteobacteria bacterium]